MELKPGYKRTDLGLIPANWTDPRLGEIGEALIGLTYSPTNVRSDGLLVLRSSNVADGSLRFDDNVFVDLAVPDKIIVKEGDILLCARNGSRDLIGKCAKIDKRAAGMTFGAFMAVFRTRYHDFVFHQFQSEILKHQIREHLGATINQITNASLNSFRIPFPDSDEERSAIAKVLDDADDLIQTLDALIAKKRDFKLAAMQQLLTGKTRLPGFSKEWQEKRLADVLVYERPDRYLVASAEYSSNGDIPVLTANKSFVLGFTSESFGVCHDVPVIIFDDFTTDSKYVAFPFKVKSSAIKLLRANSSETDLRFVFERMQLVRFPLGGHKRHYIADYRHIRVMMPSRDEQRAIVGVVSDIEAEIGALEGRRDKTRALKEGMMQELLTGKTRLL